MTRKKTNNPDEHSQKDIQLDNATVLKNEIIELALSELRESKTGNSSEIPTSDLSVLSQRRYQDYEKQDLLKTTQQEVKSVILLGISQLCNDIVDENRKNQFDSRKRRRQFAYFLCFLMAMQLGALNYFFYLKGTNCFIGASDDLFKWFMTESFLQMFGMVVYMIKKSYENTSNQDSADILNKFHETFEKRSKTTQKKKDNE